MQQPRQGATSVEVYGFVGWIASFVAGVLFCLWAWVPESMLHAVGITYYPNKQWALIIPSYLLVMVLFLYWVYESLNMMMVPPPTSLTTVLDPKSKWITDIPGLRSACGATSQRIPPLVHTPPPLVSRVLYGQQYFQRAEAGLFQESQYPETAAATSAEAHHD